MFKIVTTSFPGKEIPKSLVGIHSGALSEVWPPALS
jgi:hypothetical protein